MIKTSGHLIGPFEVETALDELRRPLRNPPKNFAGVALSATPTRHFSETEDLR